MNVQYIEMKILANYLDDAGLYISRYHKYEIPKDQRKALFNEVMIRSNIEKF